MNQEKDQQSNQKKFNTTTDILQNTRDVIELTNHNQKETQLKNQKHVSISYRPYVDGLRTIAILTVVIYHAFPKFLTGGFIGVDVFFVISGYLITGIIVKKSLKNSFSYVDFYSRRVRRIYPALLLVLVFVLIVVSKLYGPSELDFTLKTLSASTLFSANLQVLLHEKGYFDADVHTNPLLHLWSLGVEEQFYIFWPCLIGICLTKFKKHTLFGLSIYAAFSFVFGIASVFINTKFAFYFPLCRFWQMAVGGLISYQNIKIRNNKINEALSIAGTLSILITIWIVNQQSLFPGFWALVPTLAAACIIQAGSQPFINRHILSSKVFVFIGKISYPMYLWHWPLLVFSRYLFPKGSTSIMGNVQFILLMTFGLSVLTYYLIQNPIRKTNSKIILLILLFSMLIIGLSSFKTFYQAKLDFRFYDKNKIQSIIQEGQRQYPPKQQDFVQINGRMHSNLSKNKNRQFPTTQKLRFPYWIEYYLGDHGGEKILDKDILQGSKYYLNERFKKLDYFSVTNEGKQNELLIVGDSHIMQISHRFQQLYNNLMKKNATDIDKFPTVIAMIRKSNPLDEGNFILNLTRQFVTQHKPKRILLGCHWLAYLTIVQQEGQQSEVPQYIEQKMSKSLKEFYTFIKQMQNLGIQVSALGIQIRDHRYDARRMIDFNGIVEQNLKPFRRSQFRNKYKRVIDEYESKLKSMGVDMIDLTDNLCYEDICHVVSPSGYGVFIDDNHYARFYARHWTSVLDHLVQFQ